MDERVVHILAKRREGLVAAKQSMALLIQKQDLYFDGSSVAGKRACSYDCKVKTQLLG